MGRAWSAYREGRYQEALAAAGRAVQAARRLDEPDATEAVARAYWHWAACARFLTGIPVRDLFGALDAADRWLVATRRRRWRAAVLLQRAMVHKQLGEYDTAVGCAEEAVTVKLQHPDAPGYTLGGHRYQLDDILRDAGRAGEAAPHYQAILADPGSSTWERRAAYTGLARSALAAGSGAGAARGRAGL